MKHEEMVESLTAQGKEIAAELQTLEKEFNAKKEQFIRIQGALEALNSLTKE